MSSLNSGHKYIALLKLRAKEESHLQYKLVVKEDTL